MTICVTFNVAISGEFLFLILRFANEVNCTEEGAPQYYLTIYPDVRWWRGYRPPPAAPAAPALLAGGRGRGALRTAGLQPLPPGQ